MSSRAFQIVLLALVSFGAEVRAAPLEWCEVLVAPEQSARDGTDGLLGYLGSLLDEQVIGVESLVQVKEGIERGVLINPISSAGAQLRSDLAVHRDGVQEHLDRGLIDPARVLTWVKEKLQERERVRVRREETKEETQNVLQRMVFHPVGSSFDMMSTQVTQWQWTMIMGENPSRFVDGLYSSAIVINNRIIKMQTNHPVENVSWDQVQKFIQKVNTISDVGDLMVSQLIPDHQKGDMYRLPTGAEWVYLATNRGRALSRYSFGDSSEDLSQHGWFKDNSDGSTHSVAELKPLMVDGNEFFDLHGNVGEWVQDSFEAFEKGSAPSRKFRGGSWKSASENCVSTKGGGASPCDPFEDVGFRLLRIRGGRKFQ